MGKGNEYVSCANTQQINVSYKNRNRNTGTPSDRVSKVADNQPTSCDSLLCKTWSEGVAGIPIGWCRSWMREGVGWTSEVQVQSVDYMGLHFLDRHGGIHHTRRSTGLPCNKRARLNKSYKLGPSCSSFKKLFNLLSGPSGTP